MRKKILFILAILFLLGGAWKDVLCFAQGGILTKVAERGTGPYNGIAVRGNYAYCAASTAGLDILNISNPANPLKITNIEIGGDAYDVVLSGQYAYVASYPKIDYIYTKMTIINIANPAAPRLLGSYGPMSHEFGLAVSGNYLYLTDGENGIKIINISNPTTPTLAGSYDTPGSANDIAIYGHYACIADGNGGLLVLDISDPIHLIEVQTIPEIYGSKIEITQSNAYIISGIEYIMVCNYANPSTTSMVNLWTASTDGESLDISISGNYVYFLERYCDDCETDFKPPDYIVRLFDISNPNSPVLLDSIEMPAIATSIAAQGNFVYTTGLRNGLWVINASDPSNLSFAGSYDDSRVLDKVVINGNYAYLGGWYDGRFIMDISSPSNPGLIEENKILGFSDMAISGKYAYTVGPNCRVFDISKPEAPVQVGGCKTEIRAGHIAVAGNRAHLVDDDFNTENGYEILDISNPFKPVSIDLDYDYYHNVAAFNNKVYLVHDNDEFCIVGAGCCKGLGRIEGIFVSGNYAYLAAGNQGLAIIDISSPSYPHLISDCDSGGHAWDVAISGKYAFVTDENNGLVVFDISNPTNPKSLVSYPTPGEAKSLAVSGNYIYVADGSSGKFLIFKFTEIPAKSLTITSPNGGETWQRGIAHNITWTQTGLTGGLTIDLYRDGLFYSNIGLTEVSVGTYSWTPTEAVAIGSNYKIRIDQGTMVDYSNNNFSIIEQPKIVLNRQVLNFGTIFGNSTAAQKVTISNSGGGTLNWTASADQTWIIVSPTSGTGNGILQVEVNPAGASPGTYTGKITIADPAASNSPQEITITMKVWETGTGPFGEFSTPVDGTTVSGSIPVTGWALDDLEVTSVKIYRNPVNGEGSERVYIGTALFVEGARPDVELAYPDYPLNYRAGWGYMMLTNMLPNQGNGTFTIYADAQDREGNIVILGTKTITCNNAQAVKPFGAIDTPSQGGTASGKSYVNYGWALTPLPNTIPTDGSTINVWVDGLPLGHPVYNLFRSDIAALFPGYANSNGAVGYYYLDTTKYGNGIHTIAWTVKDNAGNEDGIGSRYFSIQNGQNTDVRDSTSIPLAVDLADIPVNDIDPIDIRKGFDSESPLQKVYPDDSGRIKINIRELERIEIDFSHPMENLSPLPIGSTFNPNAGIFCWQPGTGFIGTYHFVFREQGQKGLQQPKEIIINIVPKFPN